MVKRLNCWEVMNCGREPGGEMAALRGVCPAATDPSFDGVNGGRAAGRFCWQVAGTMCHGRVQGTMAEKIADCVVCPFLDRVAREETGGFVLTLEDLESRSPEA
ncbi:MAG: hypothetical protein D6702_06255 [Planctomycetota bacterium]|nr:MAG: hypothetical protein D6702_06255 [Planctomycetota bacterium]